MIDLHCHLLPDVDDGPRTLADALELARMSVADGITDAVVTPHLMPRTAQHTWPRILASYEALRQSLQEQAIPLNLHLAAEVRISGELPALVTRGQLPVLGRFLDQPVHLLEFPHTEALPVGSDQLMSWLTRQRLIPLLAHPERHLTFQRHPDRLDAFTEAGCLLQVTAGSLLGQFGRAARKLALDLLNAERIAVLASDAHSVADRPPNLTAAFKYVSNHCGNIIANRLLYDTPAQLLGITPAASRNPS
ncbi:MAG: hypothetical protein RLZZ09_3295 [Pseudomonadota bacterium]|jgi:protein-tyrosine phosphatase